MAYPYTRSYADWKDSPDTSTPINEAALDNMDAGIKSLSDIVIPNTIVDAKGDLIVATAADTVARRAVPANDKVLVADSSQASGWRDDLIKNANVDAAAAIAYSKLALGSSIVSADIVDGTIVNADISASAAIAISKIASLIAPTHVGPVFNSIAGGAHTPAANRAFLVPIIDIIVPFTFTRLVYAVVTGGANNVDLGVYYTDDEATFTRLFSTGSFAVPAANLRTKTIAAQTITPVAGRRWYTAVAFDSATPTFRAYTENAGGYFKDTSFALPATLTGMTSSDTLAPATWPQFGMAV